MDRLVDQPGGSVATQKSSEKSSVDDDGVLPEEADQDDIESELYCSTREMGISPVGFGPVDDS
jgi:hypothetical protein